MTNHSPTFIEVNGVRFETLIPQPVIKIPNNKEFPFISRQTRIITALRKLFRFSFHPSLPSTSVQLGISISNQTLVPIKFSVFSTITPQLFKKDGQTILGTCYCRMTRKPTDLYILLVQPSETKTFFLYAEILLINHQQIFLQIYSEDGNIWSFRYLNLGTYELKFIYHNQKMSLKIYQNQQNNKKLIEGLWTGNVEIPAKSFQIVDSHS